MRKDEVKAYHEAGHAVIARVLGVYVSHVMLFAPDESTSAAVQTRCAASVARTSGDVVAFVRAIEVNIKVSLAGPCAEVKHRPHTNRKRASRESWGSDLAQVRQSMAFIRWLQDNPRVPSDDAIISLNAEQRAEALRIAPRLEDETKALVEKHWPAIERVAKALLKHRALYGAEIDDLIAA